jgi:hypothetical protein
MFLSLFLFAHLFLVSASFVYIREHLQSRAGTIAALKMVNVGSKL